MPVTWEIDAVGMAANRSGMDSGGRKNRERRGRGVVLHEFSESSDHDLSACKLSHDAVNHPGWISVLRMRTVSSAARSGETAVVATPETTLVML